MSEKRFRIQPVEEPDFLRTYIEAIAIETTAVETTAIETTAVETTAVETAGQTPAAVRNALTDFSYPFLDEAEAGLAGYWRPEYLPPGFEERRARVGGGDRAHPLLIYPPADDAGALLVFAHDTEHHPVESVGRASYRAVRSGDLAGFLIEGGWVVVRDSDGSVIRSGWDREILRKLILIEPQREMLLCVEARPAALLSGEELLRVGDSLAYRQPEARRRLWLPFLNR